MSRAQGIRTLFIGKQAATQTGTPRIQIACDQNRKQTGKCMPELGARGLRGKKARRSGAPPSTALIAIGHQP